MTTENMSNNNFGLSEDEFLKLKAELQNGDEGLFEKVFLSHFKETLKHVTIKYNANPQEVYDACMEAILNFRSLIIQDKVHYGNLKYLFQTMAAQKYLKVMTRKKKISYQPTLPEIIENQDNFSNEELEVLENAWSRLGRECQELLKLSFYEGKKSQDIGLIFNKSAAAIRKQKERCVNTLRINFLKLI